MSRIGGRLAMLTISFMPSVVAPTVYAQDRSIVLTQDFRDGQFAEQNFRYAGKNAEESIQPSEQGLKISTPPNSEAGIATKFRIEGDFVFTVQYHVKFQRPIKGNSVQFQIYAPVDAPGRPAVSFSRIARQQEVDLYSTAHMIDDDQGKRLATMKTFPSGAVSGKLRLQRKGSVFTVSAAEEDNARFQIFHQWKVSDAPLRYLRVGGVTRNTDGSVEATIESITLNSDTQHPIAPADLPPQEYTWFWMVAAFAVLGMGTACFLWLWNRRNDEDEEDDED